MNIRRFLSTSLTSVKSQSAPNNRRIPRWTLLPIGICGYAAYELYSGRDIHEEDATPIAAASWKAFLMKMMPLRAMSRFWGHINSEYSLPLIMRVPLYSLWTVVFRCDLSEMKTESLLEFRNLDEFFTRELKDGVRPLAPSCLVSPADGRILHLGKVDVRSIEQVKGVTYSLDAFLGYGNFAIDENDASIHLPLHTDKQHQLYHCVIYLAPGDYHRFHSPANWVVEKIKHFMGQLLSVSPSMVSAIADLFVLNERIALVGRWTHGFFSMTAVGATNVGSIQLAFDQFFRTNHHLESDSGDFSEKCLKTNTSRSNKPIHTDQHAGQHGHRIESNLITETSSPGYLAMKGEQLGRFHLGSTIVLVFEAPDNFEFAVKSGQKVKYGQKLGDLKSRA